jgi:hypothetical protein
MLCEVALASLRRQVGLAWLLACLARLGDDVEDNGSLGPPVNLSKADLALWIGAKPRSVGTACRTGGPAGSSAAGTGSWSSGTWDS